MPQRFVWLTLCLVGLMLLGVACAGPAAPTPPTLPTLTNTPTLPTNNNAPPQPTPTLLPPPVLNTPTLAVPATTALPLPTLAPAATLPPQPLPGQIGPLFPANVNPLTGETVSDGAVLQRRPIAVKISNYPPLVRPQAGLNNADLIFEHYAEGGVTRFTAVFYGQDAQLIGSVRSGRLIDLEIPKMYDAAFAYSGASGPVRLLFRDAPFFDRIISPDFGHDGFYRVSAPNKAFEHTLFTDTFFLRTILDNRNLNTPPVLHNGMVFTVEPPAGGTPARTLEVQYTATTAFWEYNSASNRYQRWTDGAPHLDANSGAPLAFTNVVAVAANHVETLIVEDSLGNRSLEIQLWGEGPASIFRNGQRYDGRWVRAAPLDMLSFYTLQGQPLPLAVGNTFFQIVPLGFTDLFVYP